MAVTQKRTLTIVYDGHTVTLPVVRAGIIDGLPRWQEMNPLLQPPVVVCLLDVGSALTASSIPDLVHFFIIIAELRARVLFRFL